MADDVTDLNDSAGSEAAGLNAPAKPKKPKTAKSPEADTGLSVKTDKDAKGKGAKDAGAKGGGGLFALILIIILVLLIGGACAAVYFNMFGEKDEDGEIVKPGARDWLGDIIREPLINTIIWFDPEFSSINDEMEASREEQEEALAERGKGLDEREAGFVEREEEIKARENELIERENAANIREQQLENRAEAQIKREEELLAMYERIVPIYRRDLTEQELEDMISLSRTYTQMSPTDAADRVASLSDANDAAAILFFMGERNAASILAVMEVEFAAELTEILLYSYHMSSTY